MLKETEEFADENDADLQRALFLSMAQTDFPTFHTMTKLDVEAEAAHWREDEEAGARSRIKTEQKKLQHTMALDDSEDGVHVSDGEIPEFRITLKDLRAFFRQRNPEKEVDAGRLLGKYSPAHILKACRQKYGAEPRKTAVEQQEEEEPSLRMQLRLMSMEINALRDQKDALQRQVASMRAAPETPETDPPEVDHPYPYAAPRAAGTAVLVVDGAYMSINCSKE